MAATCIKLALPAASPPLAGWPRLKTILFAIAGNGRIFQLSMNGKQTFAPFAAGGSALGAILPPLLIGGLAIAALAWLFSDKKRTGMLAFRRGKRKHRHATVRAASGFRIFRAYTAAASTAFGPACSRPGFPLLEGRTIVMILMCFL